MTTLKDKRVLSVNECAEYMGLAPDTIRRYIKKGVIPHFTIGTRCLIPRPELDRVISDKSSGANNEDSAIGSDK